MSFQGIEITPGKVITTAAILAPVATALFTNFMMLHLAVQCILVAGPFFLGAVYLVCHTSNLRKQKEVKQTEVQAEINKEVISSSPPPAHQ